MNFYEGNNGANPDQEAAPLNVDQSQLEIDDNIVYKDSENKRSNQANPHVVDEEKKQHGDSELHAEGLLEEPLPLNATLLPVASFDEMLLPNILRPWIMDCAERIQIPPDFLAASCMVILASVIGRKVGIYPKAHDDWLVVPNLWGAIIGRPSQFKSPAISEMMKPLDKLADDANKKYKKDLEHHEERLLWQEAKKNALVKKFKKAAENAVSENKKTKSENGIKDNAEEIPKLENLDEIVAPVLKRYKTEDATVEKIGEILQGNPQGILIHRDELVGWLKSLDKYGREGDRSFFLESWNGNGPFTVDRIGRGTTNIPALCLSILGGIQPGPLSAYVHQTLQGGSGDDGLLQRFQMLVWPDVPQSWKNVDRKPNVEARKQVFDVFRKLDAFETFEPSEDEVFPVFGFHFSPSAQEVFNNWREILEQRLRSGHLLPALESHLAKYRSLMPSLALIYYLIETLGENEMPKAVDLESAERAVRWCEYLETHAKRLYASAEDVKMDSARALLNKIKKGELDNGFSPRDVYHGRHWEKIDTAEKVANAIKLLEDFGWVRCVTIQTGGRSTSKVYVHPSIMRKP